MQGKLPDPICTPGDILPVTTQEVCVKGYTRTVRHVPNKVKKQVFSIYGISTPLPGQYEVDHFISLELGGSNDIKNLWPQPADPKPGFRQKDGFEHHLHSKVCKGEMSLEEAQNQIRTNWYKYYMESYGSDDNKGIMDSVEGSP